MSLTPVFQNDDGYFIDLDFGAPDIMDSTIPESNSGWGWLDSAFSRALQYDALKEQSKWKLSMAELQAKTNPYSEVQRPIYQQLPTPNGYFDYAQAQALSGGNVSAAAGFGAGNDALMYVALGVGAVLLLNSAAG